MERYWQETLELLETSLTPCHSPYHKSDMDDTSKAGVRSYSLATNRRATVRPHIPYSH